MSTTPSTLRTLRLGGQIDPAWAATAVPWSAVRAVATLSAPADGAPVVDPSNGAHEHPLTVSNQLSVAAAGGQWCTAPLKPTQATDVDLALQPSGLAWTIEISLQRGNGWQPVQSYTVAIDGATDYAGAGDTITVAGLTCVDINALLPTPITAAPTNSFAANVLATLAAHPESIASSSATTVTSAGVGDAGKLIKLDSRGKLDRTLFRPMVLNASEHTGLDPTGVADSTAALQWWVTEVISGGYAAGYLPPGRYKTTATIAPTVEITSQTPLVGPPGLPVTLQESQGGLTLFGAGPGLSTIVAAHAGSILDFGSTPGLRKHHVYLRDLGFDGDSVGGSAIDFDYVYHSAFERLNICRFLGDGMVLRNGFYNTVKDCRIFGNLGDGLLFGSYANASSVIGGHFRGNAGSGVSVKSENTGGRQTHGITIDARATFESNGSASVFVSKAFDVVVRDCYFENSSDDGNPHVLFTSDEDTFPALYSSVEGCNFDSLRRSVKLDYAQKCRVVGNGIGKGIELTANSAMNWVLAEENMRVDTGVSNLGTGNRVKFFENGTTAARPAGFTPQDRVMYYDGTIQKPIFWQGSTWKDATGTTV